ncbi:MAG: gamma-butyrobetaine hydroxylase-like domain-containing protein, partial [Bdellovibrionota bacterium]|nr:gamma-butyrobetaine hydroxylase-like domain-containing protein [Bdellovibrionota bacterium]
MSHSLKNHKEKKSRKTIKVPDFRKYSTKILVKKIFKSSSGIKILWDDNTSTYYNRFWLRENSPDPQTTHPDSREQLINLLSIPDDLCIKCAEITGSGKVRIVWSPENKESFYDYSWLRFWGENRLNKQVGLSKQELWKSFSDKGLPKVTWSKENQ